MWCHYHQRHCPNRLYAAAVVVVAVAAEHVAGVEGLKDQKPKETACVAMADVLHGLVVRVLCVWVCQQRNPRRLIESCL